MGTQTRQQAAVSDAPVLTPPPNPARPPARPGNWQARGACVPYNPEKWFPEAAAGTRAHDEQSQFARSVCRRCPVTSQCLTSAITMLDYGIRAGLDERERADIAATGISSPGYCRKNRHLKTPGNRGAQGKCLPCLREKQAERRGEVAAAA